MTDYTGISQNYEDAYGAFLRVYGAQYKQPTRKTAKTERGDNLMVLALGVVLVGATIASASHTIPTLVKDASLVGYVVGFSFFVMIELAIIIFAFFNTRISGSANLEAVKRLTHRVLYFVLVIAIGANVHYVMVQNGFAVVSGDSAIAWKLFDFGVSLLFALSAPIVAFVTGEVLAIMQVYRAGAQSRLDAEYEQRLSEWERKANEAWAHNKRNWGATIKVESVPTPALTGVHSLNSLNGANEYNRLSDSPIGYTKRMDAKEVIKAFFGDHPEHMTTRLDDLVSIIESDTGVKVGRTSIHNVRKQMTD